MLVKLQRNWFYEGVRYRFRDRTGSAFIQELPDDVLEHLPSDAFIFNEKREKIGTAEEVRKGRAKAEPETKEPTAEELAAEAAKKKADLETQRTTATKDVDDAKEVLKKAEAEAEKAETAPDKAKTGSAVNAAKAALAKAEKTLADLPTE